MVWIHMDAHEYICFFFQNLNILCIFWSTPEAILHHPKQLDTPMTKPIFKANVLGYVVIGMNTAQSV
jgi:hypothetical protein